MLPAGIIDPNPNKLVEAAPKPANGRIGGFGLRSYSVSYFLSPTMRSGAVSPATTLAPNITGRFA